MIPLRAAVALFCFKEHTVWSNLFSRALYPVRSSLLSIQILTPTNWGQPFPKIHIVWLSQHIAPSDLVKPELHANGYQDKRVSQNLAKRINVFDLSTFFPPLTQCKLFSAVTTIQLQIPLEFIENLMIWTNAKYGIIAEYESIQYEIRKMVLKDELLNKCLRKQKPSV